MVSVVSCDPAPAVDQLISEACEPDGDGLINYSGECTLQVCGLLGAHATSVCPSPAVFVDYIKEEYEKIQQGGS